ncbi:hypothetical protein JCM3775_005317, partial [Rhodotorula graminis]
VLKAYFESDVAKERNVGAVWLVSGYLAQPPPRAPNGSAVKEEDAMDVDSSADTSTSAPAQASQERDGVAGTAGEDEVVQRVVQRLVQDKDLEAQLPLFSSTPRPPSTHLYALLPSPSLPSLALLGPATLSLVAPAAREKWRVPPPAAAEDGAEAGDHGGAYGELVNPDGERRRVKGATAAGRAAGAGAGASASAAKGKGKGKEPVGASSTSRTTSAAGKKEGDDEPAVAVGKAKAGADKPKAKDKKASKKDAADKDKAKDNKGPKARPIGQLGGLFSRTFDKPPPPKKSSYKSKKGKGKASSDSDSDSDGDSDDKSSGSDDDDDDDDDDDVKPVKKVVPAKRKSSSPVVTRKKAVASPVKVPKKKAADVVLDGDDGDEFDDWAMDEEALLEAERAAEVQAAQRKTSAGASGSAEAGKGKAKGKESKADRQKRELEEMMQSDDTMDVDSKPARATLSRTPSTSSAAPSKPKPKSASSTSASSGSGAPAQQKGLGAFFKKK